MACFARARLGSHGAGLHVDTPSGFESPQVRHEGFGRPPSFTRWSIRMLYPLLRAGRMHRTPLRRPITSWVCVDARTKWTAAIGSARSVPATWRQHPNRVWADFAHSRFIRTHSRCSPKVRRVEAQILRDGCLSSVSVAQVRGAAAPSHLRFGSATERASASLAQAEYTTSPRDGECTR